MDNKAWFGKNHPKGVPVVCFEFDLEGLHFLESIVPLHDAFRKDVQEAIKHLEEKAKLEEDAAGWGLRLVLVEKEAG